MRQLYEYHPALAYRFIPGLAARVQHEAGGYLVKTNAQGFRSERDFERARPVGVRRVLLFGDSYTAGDGVSNPKRYGDLLEQQIEQLEIYNFGLPGTGTDQHYLAWREFGQAIEHNALMIAVWVENIRRVASRYRFALNEKGEEVCYAKPYFELVDGRLELRQVPPAREPLPTLQMAADQRQHIDRGGRLFLLRTMVRRLGLKSLAQRVTRYQPLPEYANSNNPHWRLMRAILVQWLSEAKKPALLVPIPLYQHVEGTADPRDYQARFREVASEAGCMLHDPLPDLLRYSAEERRAFRFQTDVHLTPAGHAALANSIRPALEALVSQARGKDA